MVTVPVAVSFAYTFCPLLLACKERFAAFTTIGADDVPIEPETVMISTCPAMPPEEPVIPVPFVRILPDPAVADVDFRKKVPLLPTDELVTVIAVVVELNESEKYADPPAFAVRLAVLIA